MPSLLLRCQIYPEVCINNILVYILYVCDHLYLCEGPGKNFQTPVLYNPQGQYGMLVSTNAICVVVICVNTLRLFLLIAKLLLGTRYD